MSDVESMTEVVGTQSKHSSKSSASDTEKFKLSLPQITDKSKLDEKDSDSIDSDDEVWQLATSRRQSAIENSGSLQRVLKASTLGTYHEAVGDTCTPRDMEPLLASMRSSHFQVQRSYAIQDITNKTRGSPPSKEGKGDRRVVKDYSSIGILLVAVILPLLAALITIKFFDVVLVVKK
jgi:hypothetical protein